MQIWRPKPKYENLPRIEVKVVQATEDGKPLHYEAKVEGSPYAPIRWHAYLLHQWFEPDQEMDGGDPEDDFFRA